MNKLIKEAKTVSGSLLGLAIMMILLFFLLNWFGQRRIGPLSGAANWAASHANGTAYGNSGAVVAGMPVPVASPHPLGPAL